MKLFPKSVMASVKESTKQERGLKFVGDYYENLRHSSLLEKCATGGVVGWCVGYLLMRVMKLASALAGVAFLLGFAVHYFRVVTVDWSKLQDKATSSVSSVAARIREKAGPNVMETVRSHLTSNTSFAGGLVIGVTLGVAAS